MIVQCCVCQVVKKSKTKWVKEPIPAGEPVSHSYCPKCFNKKMAQLKKEKEKGIDWHWK